MGSQERFSNRVDIYYEVSAELSEGSDRYLYDTIGLRSSSDVADVGAGTGIFSKLLLERGSRVIGVEPNEAMREAAEKLLGEY